jgi:hypothetical protein
MTDLAPFLARRGSHFNLRNAFPDNPVQLAAECDASVLLAGWITDGSARTTLTAARPSRPAASAQRAPALHRAAGRPGGHKEGSTKRRRTVRYEDDDDYVCSDEGGDDEHCIQEPLLPLPNSLAMDAIAYAPYAMSFPAEDGADDVMDVFGAELNADELVVMPALDAGAVDYAGAWDGVNPQAAAAFADAGLAGALQPLQTVIDDLARAYAMTVRATAAV